MMNRRATTFIRLLGQATSATLGYGRLYNWYAVNAANFAPTDWKVPTLTECQTLSTYLGGDAVSGGALKEMGLTHWLTPNSGATNSSDFTSRGSGLRNYDTGTFTALQSKFYMWTQTESSSTVARAFWNSYDNDDTVFAFRDKKFGMSVRLLYTGAGTPTTMTDYNGNTYDVILIGTQYWIKQNWKCTHLSDGSPIREMTDDATWATGGAAYWCYYNNDSGNL